MVMPEGGGEEPRVNVIIGGMLDESSFQAEIQRAKELIQQLSEQLGLSFQEAARTNISGVPLLQNFDPKAVQEALKQLGTDAAQGFGLAGQAAQDYRMRINQIRNDIVNLASEQKISLGDAAKGLQMTTYSKDRNLVTVALNEELALRKKITQEIAANSTQTATLEKNNEKEVSALRKQSLQERQAQIKQTAILERSEEQATRTEKKIAVQEATASSRQLAILEQENARATAAERKAAYQSDLSQIRLVKSEIMQLAKTEAISANQAAQNPSIVQNFQPAVIRAGLEELSKTMDTSVVGVGRLQNGFRGLGLAGRYIFGTVLGIGAAQALRQIIQYLQEAYAEAINFSKSLYQLEVGVRALQRQGLNITLAGVNKEIADLQKRFPQFNLMQLTEGFAQATLSARELGLSSKDLDKFVESSIILSQVTGKDINEVMRTFALTLSSGYSEGLQKMYVNINRTVIAQKGLELGFKGGYNAMTQQERALAALAVVYEQTNKIAGDAAKFQETYAGKQGIANSQWSQTKVIWGQQILPLMAPMLMMLTKMALMLTQAGDALWKTWRIIGGLPLRGFLYILADGIILATQFWQVLSGKGWNQAAFEAQMKNVHKIIDKEINQALGLQKTMLGDVSKGEIGSQPLVTETDTQVAAEEKIQSDLGTILEDGQKERLDAEEKYKQDLEKIDVDYNRSIEDEEVNHQRKLDDITLDYQRKRDEARIDFSRTIDQDNKSRQDKIDDLNKKHQQDELEAERKFQEQMRKLQEDLLFNLEEAIRGNDIKGAAQLIRKYKLDKTQATREYQTGVTNRDEQYNIDLEKLRRDNEDQRKERIRAFNEKMADIARQEAYARIDEQKRHLQELGDLKKQNDEKRADRLKEYEREQIDLQKNFDDRLRKLADALIKENNLSMKAANNIYQNLLKYYGPNGAILKLYQYLVTAINNAAKAVAETPFGATAGAEPGTPKKFGAGGTFIATQPVTAMFGDNGPELVNAIPLNGKSGSRVGNLLSASNSMAGSTYNVDRMNIRIGLSPGLVGEIVSQSVSKMVDVVVQSER